MQHLDLQNLLAKAHGLLLGLPSNRLARPAPGKQAREELGNACLSFMMANRSHGQPSS
jgi:hypothetical protein